MLIWFSDHGGKGEGLMAALPKRTLELDLPLELHDSRYAHTAVDDAGVVWQSEILVIEQIEDLRFNAEFDSLRNRRDLEE